MKYIEDPGHGWLEVAKEEVVASGARISTYSYQDPVTGKAYLEEDCDAPAFLDAVGKLRGDDGAYIQYPSEHMDPCFIRGLPCFVA